MCMLLCPSLLHFINNGTDMSIVCDDSAWLWILNICIIYDNKVNRAFVIYFFYMEKPTDSGYKYSVHQYSQDVTRSDKP